MFIQRKLYDSSKIVFPLIALALAVLGSRAHAAPSSRIIEGKRFHLGAEGSPEWDYFEGKTPNTRRLDIRFSAQANEGEATLFLFQDDVKLDWAVELNGKKIGNLFLMEAPLVHALPISPKGLRDGENMISIVPPKAIDDIIVGAMELDPRPLKEAVQQAWLAIEVTDKMNHQALPCRLTIVNESGELVPVFPAGNQNLAARPGVVYTPDGKARVGVRPGRYTIYGSRGFEYSIATTNTPVDFGETRTVDLQLRREVPTLGWVCSDTHVHTFTYSRHGDATVEERVVTLAGEGIELPIATDHEYLTDLSQPANRMGVEKFFTPVVGCETTTAKGHFNSFPISAGSLVPDNHILDWPALMQSIRATPGVRVVVHNHPRNIHNNFQPFASTNFNAVTGENKRGFEFGFDAIEVVNSSALQSDLMLGFHDWMALLNYGYRITAVGSSDVHDVSRYIVGQGRSYVACNDSNPAKIDVNQACESFLKGRVLVSLGLLAQMTVDEKFKVGDLAAGIGESIRVDVTVLGPSWVNADLVELFANGEKIRERRIESTDEKSNQSGQNYDGIKSRTSWLIPRPKHDVYLVAIASGPGVRAPYWAIAHPYQPNSRIWKPRVIGATNPIWIDADGDGRFTAARTYAKKLIELHGNDPTKLLPALATYDQAVASQTASLMQETGVDLRTPEIAKLLEKTSEAVRRGFHAYAESLEKP